MKFRSIACLLLLTLGFNTATSYAGDFGDASGEASGLAAYGTLSLVAAPIVLVGGVAEGASDATKDIVRFVGDTGESVGELTADALRGVANTVDPNTATVNCPKPCSVNVTVNQTKKEIPLVVRSQYVELNQKIDK